MQLSLAKDIYMPDYEAEKCKWGSEWMWMISMKC